MNKNIIAVNLAKSTAFALKIFNLGSGTSMPGIVASKIAPKILSDLTNQTRKEIITVTGTNGKTTTSNFISSILTQAGRKVASNAKGANMLTGITTAMVENANISAKIDADNTVFESDEAYLRKFADYFTADYLVVTNLFRDQLDRYGELDATAKMINEAITKFQADKQKDFKLVLNADDPAIQCLSVENTFYYGFEDIKFDFDYTQSQNDVVFCDCGKQLEYSKVYYGKIGHYHCSCGNKRPETYLKATADIFVDHSIVYIFNPKTNENYSVTINMPGVYNAYNALGAITLAVGIGIDKEDIIKAFDSYETVFGRAETCLINGKNVLVQLIKNPVGAEEVLRTVQNDKNAKIFIAINDNFGDGRDVSWLWDTDFEILKNYDKQIVVSGLRYADMALRLKYAGIKQENIILEPDLKQALIKALDITENNEKLYILPAYTALLDLDKIIKKMK